MPPTFSKHCTTTRFAIVRAMAYVRDGNMSKCSSRDANTETDRVLALTGLTSLLDLEVIQPAIVQG
jgi:hypothetical protein